MVDEQKQQQVLEEIGIRLSKLANLEADELAQAMNEGSIAIFALIEQNHILRSERTACRVTAENAEKDAARYRFLCDFGGHIRDLCFDGEIYQGKADFDAAIDAAMKGES